MAQTPEAQARLLLTLGDVAYGFPSPSVFEFALSGRTGLSPSKVSAILGMTDEMLLREGEAIRKVEKRLEDVLSAAMESGDGVGDYLMSLDLTTVSQDNDWRQIFQGLKSGGRDIEVFRKIALVKYMQYLTARQEVVRDVYGRRQKRRKERAGGEQAGATNGGAGLKETLIFDVTTFAHEQSRSADEFSRLPKGETIDVSLSPSESVPVLLAKHRFTMKNGGDGLQFVDPNGAIATLRAGKNVVGRDVSSDVVIDGNLRDVSRKHLIVEVEGDALVRLTDISSLGTFVPPEMLDQTGA